MSGIAGIIRLDGAAVEPGLIEHLTGPMAARGPDGTAHWTRGTVSLGHCLLRSTPESLAEHQPLLSDDGKLALVFDGRLDNRKELAGLLGLHTSVLDTMPDSEIVLKAYQRWRSECPKRLFGDFSFAVWDDRRQRLFCARDTVGARQFYYVRNQRFFAFASDDEALTRLPGVSSQPYGELIAHLIVRAFVDFKPRQSWLQEVQMLSPAHSLSVTPGGGFQADRYWHFEQGEAVRYGSDGEFEEAFLDVFGAAVRSRLRLLGEPAMMVSGGMDSAGIAAMLGRQINYCPGNRYHAYSAIADDPGSSLESRCILSLTGHGYVTPHRVGVPSMTGMVVVEDLKRAAWARADPVDNAILLPAMMCLAASRNGHRVMFHGASGDITMGVFHRYIAPLL
ncbi:MAG: hypothetical protein KJN78_13435 [Gammaproteobacteria bacterium]|nr:hypothetical protein [Gammaproteobacteria bacterium]